METHDSDNSNEATHDQLVQEKAALRSRVIARRDAIPVDERARRSQVLCEQLLQELSRLLPENATVAAYSALGSEPDLAAFLRRAYGRGWRVCLPCMVKAAEQGEGGMTATSAAASAAGAAAPNRPQKKSRMIFLDVPQEDFEAHKAPFLVKPAKALSQGDPLLCRFVAVEAAEMDAVLVPLVAFDDGLNRLGYGGGNYDRFLGELRGDALVVGIAFKEQRVDAVPLEPHDLPLPRIARA